MSRTLSAKLAANPAAAARHAGLYYTSDSRPGIRRVRRGRRFLYVSPDDEPIRDPATLARIRGLAIPPAWKEVWICPVENGHLQATGRDTRGRKQYRYHPGWRRARTATKFHRMRRFGRGLPKIRRTVRQHLKLNGLSREKVLAAIVSLLETTHIRVGNEEYAKQNRSFGLTTLQDQHARITGSRIRFQFRGKSGKARIIELTDPRLARIVRQCQDLPGQELLQYIDQHGRIQDINSTDVNAYLREITGEDFTAKDFRTWAGTVEFIGLLRRMAPCTSRTHARRTLVQLIRQVAEALGNTPAICRKYYIHPFAIEKFLDRSIYEWIDRICQARNAGRRISTERLLMRMLKRLSLEAVADAAAAVEPASRKSTVPAANGTRRTTTAHRKAV